jgi:predicted DNA-binding transcriptional regulator YafY
MRRADRLFQIIQYLRKRRRATPARVIAERFEICKRTVYRDVHDLMGAGVPIQGEAGVGYVIDRHFELPPLMFDLEELEAIGLGISMVKSWTDDAFAQRAEGALEKIQAILPPGLRTRLDQLTVFSLPSESKIPWTVSFSEIRGAIDSHHKLRFDYSDQYGDQTRRTVRPLAMVFFSPAWLLVAWCELRQDFRNFRLDRMSDLARCEALFPSESDKSLQAYVEARRDEYE